MYFFNKPHFKRKALPKNEKIAVIKRDGLSCHECNMELHLTEFKHISIEGGIFHHVIPQVYGGTNNADNACILCIDCHNRIHSGNEKKEKYFIHFENFLKGMRLNGDK